MISVRWVGEALKYEPDIKTGKRGVLKGGCLGGWL